MSAKPKDYLWLHLRELPYFRSLLRSQEARLYQDIEWKPPVLDLGSGDGHFASVAFEAAVDIGVDPHLKSLREARVRRAYRLLLQAEGGRLPLAANAFSSVFSNSVLEHIPDVDGVLRELHRVAKRGGILVFTVPNPQYLVHLSIADFLSRIGLERWANGYRRWFLWMTRTRHLDGEDIWVDRLHKAGFSRVSSMRYFSPAANRALEIGHFLGAPTLVARWLTGRWIVWPSRFSLGPVEARVRRYYDEPPGPEGTNTLFVAHKE
jgi:SAM-dependent methyltransferase